MTLTDNTTTAAGQASSTTSEPRRGRRRLSGFVGAIVAIAIGIGGLISASPAGAAVPALSFYPTFGCTANSINVAQVKVNDNIGNVRVQVQLDVWSNGKWVLDGWSQVATVQTNLMFSELTDPSFSWRAPYNRYYEAWVYTSVNGGTWTYYPAQALRDHSSTYVCHTV